MGFNTSSSKGSQQSSAGVNQADRNRASSSGLDLLGRIEPLIQQFSQATPTLGLNEFGLTRGTQNLFDGALSKALDSSVNRFSSNLALRGLNKPENIISVIDQASRAAQREVLPTFAPIAAQNEVLESQFASNQLQTTVQLLQQLGALFQGFTQGSEGSGSQSSFGFGFDSGLRFPLGGGGTQTG